MAILSIEEFIDAPIEQVWTRLSDPTGMATWLPGAQQLTTRNGTPLAAGSELVFHANEQTQKMTVVDMLAGERLTLRTTQGFVTATYRYRLSRQGEGTRATLEADYAVRGVAWLFAPLIRTLLRNADHGQLAALKASVEAKPVQTS
ncbi:MAG: SRPBCC family protein [Alphaproteobacteria bacterium]